MSDEVSKTQTTEFEEQFAFRQGVKPTDAQVQTAQRLGMEQSEISQMQESGMSFEQWEHVVPATAMISYFQGKYPDESLDVDYMVCDYAGEYYVLHCSEGGVADALFEISLSNNDGAPYYSETYFAIWAGPEYKQRVSSIIDAAAAGAGIAASSYVASVDFCASDDGTSAQEALGKLLSYTGDVCVYVAQTANLSEDAYRAFTDDCIGRLKQAGCHVSYRFDYVLDDFKDYSLTAMNAAAVVSSNGDSDTPTYQWRVIGAF